jgi:hypothetical protein
VRLNSLILRPQVGPIYHSREEKWSTWWGNHSTQKKSALVLFFPLKIPHDLKWNKSPISVHLVSQKFSCHRKLQLSHTPYTFTFPVQVFVRLFDSYQRLKRLILKNPLSISQSTKKRTGDCNFLMARKCHKRTLSSLHESMLCKECMPYLSNMVSFHEV